MAKKRQKNIFSRIAVVALTTTCLSSIAQNSNAQNNNQIISAQDSTQVYISPNGVPVVDIAKANDRGLSHNRFIDYNVNENGLVLNNANADQVSRQSLLAGEILANQNLDSEATVILNEVTSNNRSILNGFTEVLGGSASIVVANPNGISCDGCGFINTANITLTTGTPNIDENGRISSLEVRGGDIVVSGLGLNAADNDYLAIVARKIDISGQINARDLDIVAGTNDWNPDTKTATIAAGDSDSPDYAIDARELGGMYANRVRLIATEDGVGVRMKNDVATGLGDFEISASGKIELTRSEVESARDIKISSTHSSDNAIETYMAKLEAANDINFNAINEGIIFSGGTILARNDLIISALNFTDNFISSSEVEENQRQATGEITINANRDVRFDNIGYRSNIFNGSSGQFFLSGIDAFIRTEDEFEFVASDIYLNEGIILSENDIELTATNEIKLLSTFQAIQTESGDLNITADNLDNASKLNSLAETVNLSATTALTNVGTIFSKKDLTFGNSNLDITNSGDIFTDANINITADEFSNSGNVISQLSSTYNAGDFDNLAAGFIASNTTLNTTTTSFDNLGTIKVKDATTIDTNSFDNSGDIIFSTIAGKTSLIDAQNINNLSTGNFEAEGSLRLVSSNDQNIAGENLIGQNLTIEATNDLTLAGAFEVDGTTNITANNFTNNSSFISGLVEGDFSATINGNFVNNADIQSNRNLDVNLSTSSTLNNNDSIIALNNLTINSGINLNSDSDSIFQAGNDLNIVAANADADFEGDLIAGNDLALTLNSLEHDNFIQADNDLTLNITNDYINNGTFNSLNTATITAGDLTNNGIIQTTNGFDSITLSSITNNGDFFLESASPINLTLSSLTNNSDGFIGLNSNTTFSVSGAISNSGVIDSDSDIDFVATSGTASAFTNSADSFIVTATDINFENFDIANSGIIVADNITAKKSDIINNSTIAAVQDISIEADNLTNTNLIQAGEELKITGNEVASVIQEDINLNNSGNILSADLIFKGDGGTNSGFISASNSANIEINDATSGLTNNGTIYSEGTLNISGQKFVQNNINAVTQSDALLTINLSDLTNTQGTINMLPAGGSITATNFVNGANGLIQSSEDLNITSGSTFTNAGTIYSQEDFSLTNSASLDATNSGVIATGDKITLSASDFHNSGTIDAVNNISIFSSTEFTTDNSSKIFSQDRALTITTGGTSDIRGETFADDKITITSNNSGTNLRGKVQTDGDLVLDTKNDAYLIGTSTIVGGDLTFDGRELISASDTTQIAGDLKLVGDNVESVRFEISEAQGAGSETIIGGDIDATNMSGTFRVFQETVNIFGDLLVGDANAATSNPTNFINTGGLYVGGESNIYTDSFSQSGTATFTSVDNITIDAVNDFSATSTVGTSAADIISNGKLTIEYGDTASIDADLLSIGNLFINEKDSGNITGTTFATTEDTSIKSAANIAIFSESFTGENGANLSADLVTAGGITIGTDSDLHLSGNFAGEGISTVISTGNFRLLNGSNAVFGTGSTLTAANINIDEGGTLNYRSGTINTGTFDNKGNVLLSTDSTNGTTIHSNIFKNGIDLSPGATDPIFQSFSSVLFSVGTSWESNADIYSLGNIAFGQRLGSAYSVNNYVNTALEAEGTLSASGVGNFRNAGSLQAETMNIHADYILFGGNIFIDAEAVSNSFRNSNITSNGLFENFGTLYAPNSQVTLTANQFDNWQTIDIGKRAIFNMTGSFSEFKNRGLISADSNSAGDSLYNETTITGSEFSGDSFLNLAGATIQSAKSLEVKGRNSIENDGKILASNDIEVGRSSVSLTPSFNNGSSTNANAEISAGRDLIFADSILNSDNYGLLSAGRNFTSGYLDNDTGGFTNRGVIAGGSGTFDLSFFGEVINEEGAKIIASRNSSGTGIISSDSQMTNKGSITSAGDLTLEMDFRLQNDGAIETDGDLAVKAKTDNEAITISNEGTADKVVSMISYNGELSVGGANEEVNRYDVYLVTSFNNYTTFYGHDIKLDVNRLIFDDVDEGLVAGRNFEVDTKYLWLTDSSAFLVSGVEEDGVMRITTENGDASNSFLNYGAIHSNGDADLNVNKLTNLITGGLSATGDMEISALTTVQNEGAIFTGGDLEINRDILNTERFLPESETDENGVTTLLHTYTTNAGSINVSGDFSHSLERFNNFIAPGFTADFTEDPKLIVGGDATFTGLDSDPETQVNNEDGAQIIVGGTLRFDDIKDILNKNSTISAQNMIASTDRSGATFINLVEDIFERLPCNIFTPETCSDEGVYVNSTNYSSTISASTLSLTGYTLQNQGGASDTTNFINPNLTGISVDKDGETGSADSSATSSSNEDSGATGATGQTSGDANAGTSNTSVSGTSEKAEDDQDDLGINGSGAGADLNKDADNVDPAPTSNLKAHNKSSTKADQIAAQQGTPGGAISSVNTGGQTTAINFSGLVINLPTSPNGQFVQSRDPQSGFLIETNPRFKNNLTHVGSNYLLERLNYDPDNFVRRLGDSAYETKLVREQLINQTGTNLLNRNLTEAQQMTGLMNNASSIAKDRGFQVGKALTPNQIANLDRDIVWMVETEVNGQKVLAPVVYLSANTRSLFDASNANILADNIDFDITQMANSGNIQGSETVNIRSKGDITNIGGSISGGKVQLESTEGNIQNISTKKRTTKWGNYNESIDNAASIVAEDSIYLKAAYDFNTSAGILKTTNKEGAGIAVEAGRDINVSTISLKSRKSGSKGKLTKKTKQSQTVVDSASNVIFSAGNNANITAIDMDAGGNIVLAAKNDVNLLDAKELVYKRSAKKTKSCYMCNGSIKSTKTTQTTKRSSNSVGNSLNATGDLNISAGNNVTSVGSEFKAGGDVGISAGNDIKLLTGQNITTTTTETTIKRTGAFTSSDEVGAYNERNNANAGASGEGRMAFSETTNLTETNINIKNVGNNIESGGDIILNAGNDITTVGADFKAAETIGMKGKNINNLSAQDVDVTVSNMDQTSVGLYAEGGASAQGSKQVGGNSGAGAGVGTGVYVNNTESSSVSGSTTAKTTNLEGKNIIRQASETITDEGTQMEAGENIMQKAKNINSFAAENTTFSSSETTSNEAKVGAYADAGADTGGVDRNTGEDGKTGASYTQQGAGGEAGGKVRYDYSNNKSSSNSSDAVTSNMKAGGNIVSISENDTTFEGTNIEAGGNVGIGAENLNFKAAQDTSSSSKSNTDVSVEAKVAKGTDASKSVSAEAGVNMGSENKSSNEAVTGNIKSGGDTTILTTGDQTFEGVDINSNGDLTRKAVGVINDNSASSSSNASKNEIDVNVSTGFSKSKNSGGTKQKDRSGSLGVNVTSIDKASSSSKDTKVNATGDNITESGVNNVDLNSLEK